MIILSKLVVKLTKLLLEMGTIEYIENGGMLYHPWCVLVNTQYYICQNLINYILSIKHEPLHIVYSTW